VVAKAALQVDILVPEPDLCRPKVLKPVSKKNPSNKFIVERRKKK
jgi:hypothetical protein